MTFGKIINTKFYRGCLHQHSVLKMYGLTGPSCRMPQKSVEQSPAWLQLPENLAKFSTMYNTNTATLTCYCIIVWSSILSTLSQSHCQWLNGVRHT